MHQARVKPAEPRNKQRPLSAREVDELRKSRGASEEQDSQDGASAGETDLKRYNLVLPHELFDEVKLLADQRHTTVLELIRRFIRLGLLTSYIADNPDAMLLIREGDTERELVLL